MTIPSTIGRPLTTAAADIWASFTFTVGQAPDARAVELQPGRLRSRADRICTRQLAISGHSARAQPRRPPGWRPRGIPRAARESPDAAKDRERSTKSPNDVRPRCTLGTHRTLNREHQSTEPGSRRQCKQSNDEVHH